MYSDPEKQTEEGHPDTMYAPRGAGTQALVQSPISQPLCAAMRFNSTIKAFYERLRAKGTPKKVALTDCMRKLLTILGAML